MPRRTIALAALVTASVAALAGCTATPARSAGSAGSAAPPGTTSVAPVQTVEIGGTVRTFRVHVPQAGGSPSSAQPPRPLVVVLHGGFGSGQQAESAYGWDAEADRAGFVVAYPDGIDHAWNVGGGCCGTPGRTGVDDVAFVADVVTTLSRQTPIDPRRVYATGISNGGMLAYRLACDTRLFAAIGPDSATELGPCPAPWRVSVIHVHGTADHAIPYAGGPGDGVARIDGPSVPSLVASWRAVDGCDPPAVAVAGPVTTALAACPDGRAVELITIAGAGHQWPGSAGRPVLERLLHLDPPSTALDATGTIWRFFAAHPAPVGGWPAG